MRLLKVSSSPHRASGTTTSNIMLTVIIALFPSLLAATLLFGYRAVILTAVTVASCVAFEYIFRKLLRRENTISDLSAVVTGIILALNMPVSMPYWMAVVGAFVAIVVAKEFFGGIGQNFANPAIVGRIVLMLSFTSAMTTYTSPVLTGDADAITSATPLAAEQGAYTLTDLFFGFHGGTMGEVCGVAIIIGFVILVVKQIISPIIPLCYVGSYFLFSLIAGQDALYLTLSGGLLFGAVFMATDYVTSPVTKLGRVIFAVGCGLITFVIRSFGAMSEGVSFAILIMNLLVPLIERVTQPRPFGKIKKERAAK